MLDIYSIMHESTGAIKSIYICCGHAVPVDMKRVSLSTNKSFVLGLEIAVVAQGRAPTAERTVEFRAKGKAVDSAKEPPIMAHALGDTTIMIRPIEDVAELSSIVGSKAIAALRGLLLRSELFRVLIADTELVEGRHVLSFLNQFPAGLSRAVQVKLGEAVLSQALASTVKGLEAACTEQARTYTADKQNRAMQTFTTVASQLVQLAVKVPSLHLKALSKEAQQKLLAKLLKMTPKIGVALPPLPPAGAAAAAPERRNKRGKEEVASHNSPAGKQSSGSSGKESAQSDVRPIPNSRLAALGKEGSPAYLTPLAQGQAESNSSKLVELAGKLATAEQSLVQVRAELAEEKRNSVRLQGEVTAAKVQITALGNAESTIAGLRAELKVKDESLKDLRHSQALWSSMFMAKTSVEPDCFERLMRAQKGDGGGSSSSN